MPKKEKKQMKVIVTHTPKKSITMDELFYIIFGSEEELYEECLKKEKEQRPSK